MGKNAFVPMRNAAPHGKIHGSILGFKLDLGKTGLIHMGKEPLQ